MEEKEVTLEAVIAVVNTGFSDMAMNAAKEAGARGGTIVHGRGTSTRNLEKRYGIAITPDKELVFTVVKASIRDQVMEAINKEAGIETKAQGIVFSIPVSHACGVKVD